MVKKVKEPVEVVAFEATTPSGIEVRFQSKPKRKYEVRLGQPLLADPVENDPRYEWHEVPSVTTVLGVLDKPGLPWWGMKVGVEGALDLHERGVLREVPFENRRVLAVPGPVVEGQSALLKAGVDEVVAQLTALKLTVNDQRDKAGSRGTAVHDAFELWAKDGTVPDPSMFPPTERGYVEGLCAFLDDVKPEPIAAEVMVGSVEHGFAGRYDVRLRVPEECQVVYKRTPVKGAQYADLAPGIMLGDLKTSSGVYPSHSRQLEAYEAASVECGYDATDYRGIIHVGAGGTYELVRSTAVFEDFLCVLRVWQSDESMKKRRAK